MSEKLENWKDLSEIEKARLLQRLPITKDDDTAICTKSGWAKYQGLITRAERFALQETANQKVKK